MTESEGLPLFDDPAPRSRFERPRIREAFEKFHAENPQVYFELRKLALDLVVGRGRRHIGIRMLWEVLRWSRMSTSGTDYDDFKLNDHFPPHYARLLERNEPELEGVFELRELRAE